MKRGKQIITYFLCILIVISSCPFLHSSRTIKAAEKEITAGKFIKYVVDFIEAENECVSLQDYLQKACDYHLVEEGEIKDIGSLINREQFAAIINRLDEKLNGKAYDKKLYQCIKNQKRISDLSLIKKNRQDAVIKLFEKGIMKGYSNGTYSQSRKFNGKGHVTEKGVKEVLSKIRNKKQRCKISPDGQLIRTTKLPKNYKSFSYILQSFPNKFYEKRFLWQGLKEYSIYYKDGKEIKKLIHYKEKRDMNGYVLPAHFTKYPYLIDWGSRTMKEKEIKKWLENGLNSWCKNVEKNLKYRLNVNYKNIGDKWVLNILDTYRTASGKYNKQRDNNTKKKLKEYVKYVKKNHLILKSSKIVVEPSTLYSFDMQDYVRCYIKFKLVSATNKKKLVKEGKYLFSTFHYAPEIKGISSGKWKEMYVDIPLSGSNNDYGKTVKKVVAPESQIYERS